MTTDRSPPHRSDLWWKWHHTNPSGPPHEASWAMKETRRRSYILWLLDANKTEADILCREKVDGMVQIHSSISKPRLHVHHTL
jgi:hypothetical protein